MLSQTDYSESVPKAIGAPEWGRQDVARSVSPGTGPICQTPSASRPKSRHRPDLGRDAEVKKAGVVSAILTPGADAPGYLLTPLRGFWNRFSECADRVEPSFTTEKSLTSREPEYGRRGSRRGWVAPRFRRSFNAWNGPGLIRCSCGRDRATSNPDDVGLAPGCSGSGGHTPGRSRPRWRTWSCTANGSAITPHRPGDGSDPQPGDPRRLKPGIAECRRVLHEEPPRVHNPAHRKIGKGSVVSRECGASDSAFPAQLSLDTITGVPDSARSWHDAPDERGRVFGDGKLDEVRRLPGA